MSPRAYSTLNLLALCRTGSLGYNSAQCTGCGHQEWFASSCGDRHCPQCLGPRQAQWSEQTCARLPDCPHFHLVFTLPEELGAFFKANYRAVADLFFAAAAETIQSFLRQNWGCAKGAYFSVLHTWGSALTWHPHLHVLISAGGICAQSGEWKAVRPGYAFPVKGVMSRVFGAIFVRRLEELEGQQRSIQWPEGLGSVEERRAWRVKLCGRHWNIFCRPTLENTRAVVRYLARYTSRIAISNRRIRRVDPVAKTVTIHYKDYREEGRRKDLTLSAKSFLKRFSQHLCPQGFRRIRQYGLLCGKAGAFRSLARAPQRSIGEGAQPVQVPCCPNCQRSHPWRYGRTHQFPDKQRLESYSLMWLVNADHPPPSNKRMEPTP